MLRISCIFALLLGINSAFSQTGYNNKKMFVNLEISRNDTYFIQADNYEALERRLMKCGVKESDNLRNCIF